MKEGDKTMDYELNDEMQASKEHLETMLKDDKQTPETIGAIKNALTFMEETTQAINILLMFTNNGQGTYKEGLLAAYNFIKSNNDTLQQKAHEEFAINGSTYTLHALRHGADAIDELCGKFKKEFDI